MKDKITEIIEKFNSKEMKNNIITNVVENDPEYSIIMRNSITTDEFIIYLNNETKMVEFESTNDTLYDDAFFEVPFKRFKEVITVINKLMTELNK